MKNVPENVLRLWAVQGFIRSLTLLVPITVEQGSKIGSKKFEDKGFGNRTVIGFALVNADGDGTKGANGRTAANEAVITIEQMQLMHLEIVGHDDKKICEDLPLSVLLPRVNQTYTPFYLEDFNPGKSTVKWCDLLGNTASTVNLQLVIYTL